VLHKSRTGYLHNLCSTSTVDGMSELRRLPGPVAATWEWQVHGLCRDMDVEAFYHPDGERGPARARRENAAKAVCARCPVVRECAAYALTSREPFGIWGGLSESDRADILAGRREYEYAATG
jgi:WhiB family transcriptional regulator, redox-sensing transcriptional regulator